MSAKQAEKSSPSGAVLLNSISTVLEGSVRRVDFETTIADRKCSVAVYRITERLYRIDIKPEAA